MVAALVVFYLVLCPGSLFAYLLLHRRQLESAHFRMTFGFLYRGYQKQLWFWEFLDMLHKVFLTSLLQFLPMENGTAMTVGLVVASCYLLGVILVQPFIINQVCGTLFVFCLLYNLVACVLYCLLILYVF